MYDNFHQKLKEVCRKYRISLRFSDVLEETVAIKLAGMKAVPSRCQFFEDKTDEQFMFIGFDFNGQAMPLEDKERLIQYFNMKFKEAMLERISFIKADDIILEAASAVVEARSNLENYGGCQYVYDKQKQLHCFRLNCNDVMNYLLPDIEQYLAEAAAQHPEALAAYQQRSAHEFTCDDLRENIPAFLETYYIDSHITGVFEKSLLEMAGCVDNPKRFRIYPAAEIGKVVFSYDFGIHGMSESDRNRLLSFFKAMGDETASYDYKDDEYCFYVRHDILNRVFNAFKKHIDLSAEMQSESFKAFQSISNMQSQPIKRLRLRQEMTEIGQTLKEHFMLEKVPTQDLDDFLQALRGSVWRKSDFDWDFLRMKDKILNELVPQAFQDHSHQASVMRSLRQLNEKFRDFKTAFYPNYYMVFLTNPQYQLAQKVASSYAKLALSQFHLMVPNAQIPYEERYNANYPYKIEAHIASYLADNNKYTCKFGVDGSLLYPSDIGKNDAEAREKFELDVYCAAKKIVAGKNINESKQGMFSSLWSFFAGASKESVKEVNKKRQFDEFLEARGVKNVGGEPTFKMR